MSHLIPDFLKRIGLRPHGDVAGECLQFGSGTKNTSALLGLDFGTSCSKAVIHLPYVPNQPAFAVPLSKDLSVPYLARTAPLPDGRGPTPRTLAYSPRPNPKVDLLVEPEDKPAQILTVILLSRLMRAARRWFLEENGKAYGEFRLDWQANIGIPSSGYENRSIEATLTACARAAWEMSKRPAPPDEAQAAKALDDFGGSSDVPVGSMPEIAAAAVAYTRSIYAHDGMHVMLDVGASTLDICGFMLRPAHPDQPFGLFSAVVEHVGAAVLHDDRVRAVIEHGDAPGTVAMGDARDPAFKVPDDLAGYTAGKKHPPDYLSEVDQAFQEQCALALRTVLAGLYKMNPNGRWDAGVPVFMSGGGGGMKFYRKIVEDIPVRKADCKWRRVSIADLTQPGNLRPGNLPTPTVDRMLVAYGLSVPGGAGIQIVNPATLPEVPPPPRRRLDHRYVSKDDV